MNPAKKTTYIIAAVALVLLVAVIYFLFVFQKGKKEQKVEQSEDEIKQMSDIPQEKKPYIALTPTADGAEIIISIKNMQAFDKIEYNLTYQADNPQIQGEKIERGAIGSDVNTKDPEYKKSVLLGTASKGVRSPDTGIVDGKLTINAFQGNIEYTSESPWDLIKVGSKITTVSSRDQKLSLDTPLLGKDYWLIISDTVGIAPNPPFNIKNALLPSLGTFSIAPTFSRKANLSIKTGDLKSADIYKYKLADAKWEKLDSKFDPSAKEIKASVDGFATFVVVSSQ